MATVDGLGTTYNLPNYTGELFSVAPYETPFLSALGGLGAGKRTTSTEFEWQTEGLEDSEANNVRKEGSKAPDASEVVRKNVKNVVEIHQEAVEISYTKQAAFGQLAGIATAGANQPVTDELDHQVRLKLRKLAVDLEKSGLYGKYDNPSKIDDPRKTRGLLEAVESNVFESDDDRKIDKDILDEALGQMFDNGAPLTQDTTVLMVGPAQKVMLSNAYMKSPLNQPTETRNVGGFALDTLITDFGQFGIMLNRWMKPDEIGIVDLSVCSPVFLEIPDKGTLFVEPLARVGASEKYQVYGEFGLEYGPEQFHGLIKSLDTGKLGSESN